MIRTGTALGALAAVLALPSAAQAQTESRASADVSATAGYSNNPFETQGDDTGAPLVSIDIAPRYQLLTQRSTFTVSADANLQQYLRRYGHNENYSGAVDYQGRPSESVTAHARIDLSSSVLGAYGGYVPTPTTTATTIGTGTTTTSGTDTVPAVTVPVTPVLPFVPITDIGLFGLRNREQTARVSGDMGVAVTARDELTVSGYAEATRYHRLEASNYEAYSGSVGYSRRVSDYVTAGVRGTVSVFDYRVTGNTQAYSIQATASARLSAIWSADGALGVSIVSGDSTRSTSSTSLSGNINVCRRGQLSTMCAQLARDVSPTGLAGTQYVTTAGLNWSRRLDERSDVSLNASYSDVGGGDTRLVDGVLPLQTQYVQAFAGYDRQLRQRLRLVASVNYRQLLDGDNGRPKDFGGQIGLSYRLGDTR